MASFLNELLHYLPIETFKKFISIARGRGSFKKKKKKKTNLTRNTFTAGRFFKINDT